jgi:GH15 family glucan-1,4-alpha-glucosidase
MFDPREPKIVSTMEQVASTLWCKTDIGGLARYENDYYHQVSQDIANVPGNPWIICTLWLAQWHIARSETLDELRQALDLLSWVQKRTLDSGVLAEQVHPYTGAPMSVAPLTWSHATVVTTVREYLVKLDQLCESASKRALLDGEVELGELVRGKK